MQSIEYEVRIVWDLPEGVTVKLKKRLKAPSKDVAIAEAAARMAGGMPDAAKSGLLEAVDVTVRVLTSNKVTVL